MRRVKEGMDRGRKQIGEGTSRKEERLPGLNSGCSDHCDVDERSEIAEIVH